MAEVLGIVGGALVVVLMGEGWRRHALGRAMERQFALVRVRADDMPQLRRED